MSLSLDDVTVRMWEGLPVGERSKRIREAIKNAAIVNERDMLVEALRGQLDERDRIISDMKLYCRCIANRRGEEVKLARLDLPQGQGEPKQGDDEE